jgi:hypothetical protein
VTIRDKHRFLRVTRLGMRRLLAEFILKRVYVVRSSCRRFANRALPAYEPDGGPLSSEQLATIRRLAGRQEIRSVSSTLQ